MGKQARHAFPRNAEVSNRALEVIHSDVWATKAASHIYRLEFRRFFVYVLDVKWQMNMVEKGPNATIKRHESGYVTIDSTKFWQTKKDRLILPQ